MILTRKKRCYHSDTNSKTLLETIPACTILCSTLVWDCAGQPGSGPSLGPFQQSNNTILELNFIIINANSATLQVQPSLFHGNYEYPFWR